MLPSIILKSNTNSIFRVLFIASDCKKGLRKKKRKKNEQMKLSFSSYALLQIYTQTPTKKDKNNNTNKVFDDMP